MKRWVRECVKGRVGRLRDEWVLRAGRLRDEWVREALDRWIGRRVDESLDMWEETS